MEEPLEVELRDGTVCLIRRIRPDDRARLEEGFRKLSPESRYLRFHSFVQRLTEAQIRYFTEVDQHDHLALVALDRDAEGRPGMGVARYVRLREEPTVAEAAVTVLDEYQGRGLGTLLLGLLAREAIDNGVKVFRSYVLAENTPMLKLFEALDATREADEAGVYRVDLPLPVDPRALPDTPTGRVFRAAAHHLLPDLDIGLPPVWDEWTHREDGGGEEEPSRLERARELWSERGQLRDWLDEMLGPRPDG